jgi:two-component system, NarL family, sensor kinase
MTRRARRPAPALVAGAAVAVAIATVVLHLVRGQEVSGLLVGQVANAFQSGLVFGVVAAAVLRDSPGNRLGPIMAFGGGLAAVSALADEYAALANEHGLPAHGLAGWVAGIAWLPGFVTLVVLVPLLFPDGHLLSPRWRWPARVAVAAIAVATLLFASTQDALQDNDFGVVDNPLDLPLPDGPQLAVAAVLLAGAVLVSLAAIIGVLWRLPRVTRDQRPRYAWFAAAVLLAFAQLLPLPELVTAVLNVSSFAALGTGIVRHRMFDIEPVLPRALAWLVLVAAALAVYLAAAAMVGAEVGAGVLPALLTAVAMLLLARLQGRLLRAVRRFLYGERDDPDAALTRLGDRLAATLGTAEALPASVEAVRGTLRVPYAAIGLAGEPHLAAVVGHEPGRTVDLSLVHAGTEVGVLRVGLRTGERLLAQRDEELLGRFTPHLAAVAHEIRTTHELRRSREQLVTLREQERARIHRDLHDGLGPALAGISLGLETAARVASRDGSSSAVLLEELRVDAAGCVDDVRSIVADLRPSVLDDGGLTAALRRCADLLVASTGGGLEITVEGPGDVALPPAGEVAAYRIATEAMTNATRHANASRVVVSIRDCDGLHIVVEDDGTGKTPTSTGTGLASMRERAEELGGTCTVQFHGGVGTRVEARLP